MSEQLKPIIQRPQDLILALASRDILPETQILVEHTHTIGDWQLRFAIIGESHRVQITHQGQFVLEEMLACVDVPLQECEHHHPFDDLQAHDFAQSSYRVSVQMKRDHNQWQAVENEISYSFPEIDGIAAETRIQWQESASCLQWRTLHTYIDSGEILCVYSQSDFTFDAKG